MAYRILSLDGGGTWALLQAMALADIYPNESGREILGKFDLAVANSGGSIVLAGLMLDLEPADILAMFDNQAFREGIFHKKSWIEEALTGLPFYPRYIAAEKAKGLAAAFRPSGDMLLPAFKNLADWPKRPSGQPTGVLIVGFERNRLHEDFFRSYPVPLSGQDATQISLRDAVHASSNAPVRYFDAPAVAIVGGVSKNYWDGAMGAYNNPVMAGVVDAMALEIDPKSIEILSIGTGTVRLLPHDLANSGDPPPPAKLIEPNSNGLLADIATVTTCINDDPPDAATYTAHIVTGNAANTPGRLVRLNPVVRPEWDQTAWGYPAGIGEELFLGLAPLNMDLIAADDVDLVKQLGAAWLAGSANQFIRNNPDFSTGMGDKTFAAAKARWLTM